MASSSFNLQNAVDIYINATDSKVRQDLFLGLTADQKKQVRSAAKERQLQVPRPIQSQTVEFEAPEDTDEDDIPLRTPATTPAPSVSQLNPTGKIIISDDEVSQMWTVVETFDVSQIDAESIRIFEYEGFNPDVILKALMSQKQVNRINNTDFLRDISILCGLAVVKGTVNDNNFKKMKKSGQDTFMKLSAIYGIKMGSAKGQASDVVTVARVAAAFPGVVLNLLHNNKVSSRDFSGPMKSSKLPSVMRHQALATCIPREASDSLRDFILSAIVAFSVDQSIIISARKIGADQAISTQRNFIKVAHEGRFPREEVRKVIFNQYNWDAAYSSISNCVRELMKKDDSFTMIDQQTFKAELVKLS